MAKADFYYSPLKDNDDRALCFACTVTLVCWEPSDSPWTEHGRHSPHCPFIKGDFTENVPLHTTCSIQPRKKIFSNQQQQKWLIKSNEIILNEHILLFINSDWIIRSVDTTNNSEENSSLDNNNETIFIQHFDHLTSKRYFNLKLNPLALTIYPLTITNDNENYIIFCFLQLIETNKCILITTTTTLNQYENLNPSRTSTVTNNTQNDESIETTTIINEQIKINNKYDY
ncbi:unnamed protein product [Rotaria sordida]|nr:unnamed protein product [Rotaria sordida]CAF1344678.1 unnamed protein product [Rotaria sordida]CAF4016274.1 unnamed protein product [Rotaria sordida]